MARTTDDLVTAQVTISVLREDLDDHDGEPLQALSSHLDRANAVYYDVLDTLGGVVWRLLDGEQRDEEDTDTDTERAEELALAYARGRDRLTRDIMTALRGDHAAEWARQAHALIKAVREAEHGTGQRSTMTGQQPHGEDANQ